MIQKTLQDALARLILEDKLKDGETVNVTVKNDALVINGEALLLDTPPTDAVIN